MHPTSAMRNLRGAAGVAALIAVLTGCGHLAYWTTDYFPAGSSIEAYEYRLGVVVARGSGRAEAGRTPKRVAVTITDRRGDLLLEREYHVRSDVLEWKVRSPTADVLEIVFFEYAGTPPMPRQVLALHFERAADHRFIETGVPEWVRAALADELERNNQRQSVELELPLRDDTRTAVLAAAERVAGDFRLAPRRIPPESAQRLAHFTASDFDLRVVQYDAERRLTIVVENRGRRDLSQAVVEALGHLQIDRTRRVVNVTVPHHGDPTSALAVVADVARDHGVVRNAVCPEAYIACYGTSDIRIQVWPPQSPPILSVHLAHIGAMERGLAIERALRQRLAARRD